MNNQTFSGFKILKNGETLFDSSLPSNHLVIKNNDKFYLCVGLSKRDDSDLNRTFMKVEPMPDTFKLKLGLRFESYKKYTSLRRGDNTLFLIFKDENLTDPLINPFEKEFAIDPQQLVYCERG